MGSGLLRVKGAHWEGAWLAWGLREHQALKCSGLWGNQGRGPKGRWRNGGLVKPWAPGPNLKSTGCCVVRGRRKQICGRVATWISGCLMNLTCGEVQVGVVPELVVPWEADKTDGEPRFHVTEGLDCWAAESTMLENDSAERARA